MTFDDAFLRKIYKGIALLWMLAAIFMSIGVGLHERNFKDGAEFFLFMLYPYYAIAIIYLIVKEKYWGLKNSQEKWMQDGVAKVAATISGERFLIGLLLIFSFIPYFFVIIGILKLMDWVVVRI